MKTTLTRTIAPEEAMSLITRSTQMGNPTIVADYYAQAESFLNFRSGSLIFQTITSGGHYHSLTICYDGTLTVEHHGARSSYPSMIFNLIPKEFSTYARIQEWTLVEYETSEPEWSPVAGLLWGDPYYSNCPCNAEEADAFETWERVSYMQEKLSRAGIKKILTWDISEQCYLEVREHTLVPLSFTRIEYRRLSACGIEI